MMILNDDVIVSDDSKGIAAVGWQTTLPVDPRAVNYNYMGSPLLKSAVDRLIATRSTVMWAAIEAPGSAFFLQPIISADESLVAFLFVELPWKTLFEGPGESPSLKTEGVSCVIHDQCNSQSIEIDLHGDEAARPLEKDELHRFRSASTLTVSHR